MLVSLSPIFRARAVLSLSPIFSKMNRIASSFDLLDTSNSVEDSSGRFGGAHIIIDE